LPARTASIASSTLAKTCAGLDAVRDLAAGAADRG